MKYLFFSTLVLAMFLAVDLLGQSKLLVVYECTRSNTFEEQLEEDKKNNPHAINYINQLYKYAEQINNYKINFKLAQYNEHSFFSLVADKDNGVSTWEYETGPFSFALPTKDDVCYKNLKTRELQLKRKRQMVVFCVEDKLGDFKWEIQNVTKKILGYDCFQAISSYQSKPIVAWFATEIPISNGPLEYGGLPGLILELKIWDNMSIFKAIEIYSNKETSVPTPLNDCNKNSKIYTLDEMWKSLEQLKSQNKEVSKKKQ